MIGRVAGIIGLGLAGIATGYAAPSPARAVPVLDQVNDPREALGAVGAFPFESRYTEVRLGQSFRVGLEGLLTRVDYMMDRSRGTTGTAAFELFRLDGTGRPVGESLSAWTFAAGSLPETDWPDDVPGFMPLVLETPVAVLPDDVLGLTLRRTGTGDTGWLTYMTDGDRYPRGAMLGWSWQSGEWTGFAGGAFQDNDLGIRNFVDPAPLPADILIDGFAGVGSPSPFPMSATIVNPAPLGDEFGVPDTVGGYRSISLSATFPDPANGPPMGELVVDLDGARGVLTFDTPPGLTPLGGLVYLDDGTDPDLDLDLTEHHFVAVDYAGLTADLPLTLSLFNAVNGDPTVENFGAFTLPAGSGTAYFALDDIDQVRFGSPGPVDLTSIDAFLFGFSGETGGTELELDRLYFTAEAVLSGDYNASGLVEQGDLDLVLSNWGVDTDVSGVPNGWVNDLPDGLVDQAELDKVLSNWGNSAAPDFGVTNVPEPSAWVGLIACAIVMCRRR